MDSSYTSYIAPVQRGSGRPYECDEEVKLIKDIKRPDKFSVRNVEKVESEFMTPTIFLRKGRQQKERIPFHDVSEYRTSPALDIIELRSDNDRSVFIRIKSRESFNRWLDYLKTFLPPSDNEYEIPDACRGRSSTNTAHNRPTPRKTPRRPGNVQSVVDMVPTTFPTPVSTHRFEDSLPENEEYEVVSYENYPPPGKDYASLRSTEDPSTSDDDPEGVYHDVKEVESQTIVNDVIHNRPKNGYPPLPPKRGTSIKTQESPRTGHATIKDILQNELRDTLHHRTSVKSKPSHRTNIRQPKSEIEEARDGRKVDYDEEEGASGGLYVVRQTSRKPIGGPALTTFKPEVPRRIGTVISRENAKKREGTIMEDYPESSPLSSPCSSDDEEDSNAEDDAMIHKDIYADNARLTMKCEMEKPDGITCHAELGQLQHLGIVTTQYGACINDIPANLQRKFYHGDKIISINEQRIKDASFARSIIETSECKMVKVTVRRLFKGHFIELERETIGSSEELGFALHNGTEILYISPGTMFAKQATGDMMAEKRCITHIEKKFVPPGTPTKEVNVALRNAGHKFHIILQPVEFMKELMSQS